MVAYRGKTSHGGGETVGSIRITYLSQHHFKLNADLPTRVIVSAHRQLMISCFLLAKRILSKHEICVIGDWAGFFKAQTGQHGT